MSKHRMSCGEALERLPLYVGDDLDPESLDAMRGHVESCPSCSRRAGEALRARRALVEALQSPAGGHSELWGEIRSVLVSEGLIHSQPLRAKQGPRPRRTSWRLALVPATLAAALVAVTQFGRVPVIEHQKAVPYEEPMGPVVSVPVKDVSVPLEGGASTQGTLKRVFEDEMGLGSTAPFRRQRSTQGDPSDPSLANYGRLK